MSWNYRIIHHDVDPEPANHWLGLHEIYYSENGKLSWTLNAVSFICDADEGPDGIIGALNMALKTFSDPRFAAVLKMSDLIKSTEDGDAH